MAPPSIYLDNNSTTPIDPRVVEAMARAWKDCGANPASQHSLGRKARRMLEEAREGIAQLLGAKTGGMDADQVIFTSGGTEANNAALIGLVLAAPTGHREMRGLYPSVVDDLIVSAVEHPSVMVAMHRLRSLGHRANIAKTIEMNGQFDSSFYQEFDSLPFLVAVMLANNETGIIHPVAEITRVSREYGILVHTDAVQAVGKLRVNFRDLDVDAMTVAPHKFHGPLGIGALILRHEIKLEPQLYGGFQQAGLRPGTENVALAIGFREALRLATSELADRATRMQSLRNALENALRNDLSRIAIIGEHAPRLPNTSCISFPGLDRQALVMALDLAGIACSTGSACASGSSEPSPTLVAMGLPNDVIGGAIRFSLGAFTTADEVTEAARRIINTVKHLQSQK